MMTKFPYLIIPQSLFLTLSPQKAKLHFCLRKERAAVAKLLCVTLKDAFTFIPGVKAFSNLSQAQAAVDI